MSQQGRQNHLLPSASGENDGVPRKNPFVDVTADIHNRWPRFILGLKDTENPFGTKISPGICGAKIHSSLCLRFPSSLSSLILLLTSSSNSCCLENGISLLIVSLDFFLLRLPYYLLFLPLSSDCFVGMDWHQHWNVISNTCIRWSTDQNLHQRSHNFLKFEKKNINLILVNFLIYKDFVYYFFMVKFINLQIFLINYL